VQHVLGAIVGLISSLIAMLPQIVYAGLIAFGGAWVITNMSPAWIPIAPALIRWRRQAAVSAFALGPRDNGLMSRFRGGIASGGCKPPYAWPALRKPRAAFPAASKVAAASLAVMAQRRLNVGQTPASCSSQYSRCR